MLNIFALMAALILLVSLFVRNQKNSKKIIVIVSCSLMFIVMGFRDAESIGVDAASSYLHNFQAMKVEHWSRLFDIFDFKHNPGIVYLMKIVSVLTNGNYQIFIMIISGFIMSVLGYMINKYAKDALQAVMCFWGFLFFTFMFNALKQTIAMGFIMLAFDRFYQKKWVSYFVLMFFAVWFHFPAIVFLGALLTTPRIGKAYFSRLAIMILVVFVFKDTLLDMMTDVYSTNLSNAVETMRFFSNKALIMIGIVVTALILKTPDGNDRLYSLIIQFCGFAIVFQMFCKYNNTFERLGDYFFQFAIFLLPMIFERKRTSTILSVEAETVLKDVLPIPIYAFFIWRMLDYAANSGGLSPYKFFF